MVVVGAFECGWAAGGGGCIGGWFVVFDIMFVVVMVVMYIAVCGIVGVYGCDDCDEGCCHEHLLRLGSHLA